MILESVDVCNVPNDKWIFVHQRRVLTIRPQSRFRQDDTFFTIGSCFAEEIRIALTNNGIGCLPAYSSIKYDRARVIIDTLPDVEHMNYYNTFSIRQEIERAAGLWKQNDDDFWVLPKKTIRNSRIRDGQETVYQDPYRRYTFGLSQEELFTALAEVNSVMKAGLMACSVVVITLGTTEVFKKKNNGLVANQIPTYERGGGEEETYFHASTFAENYENLTRTVDVILSVNPRAQVVISVSPVPLARSFSGNDIYVANQLSKATLRAVAGEVSVKYRNVLYFPSYEIITGLGRAAFANRDTRHIKRAIVDLVVKIFLEATFEGSGDADGPFRHFNLAERLSEEGAPTGAVTTA